MQLDFGQLNRVPRHVAIIMDGNSRWATKHNLPALAGHKAGYKALRLATECCARSGVEVLTVFAFSSENWRRPQEEIKGLMGLFSWALSKKLRKLVKNDIRLEIIGDRLGFSEAIQSLMASAEAETAHCTGMTLVVAANYGGQWDMTQASRAMARRVKAGTLSPEDITPERLEKALCLANMPPVDLCVRTAGEQRLSNFLLWQLAYAELQFSPLFWPDFNEHAMFESLQVYAGRDRRFGARKQV